MPENQQTATPPLEKIANRVATAGAGLAAAAKAVALGDHRRMLDDHASRVRDTHRLQMRAIGLEVGDAEEGDDMGDVIVTGDITVSPPPSRNASKLLPYALAAVAALSGGGLGAGLTALLASRESATPIVTGEDADTQYELRISSGEVEP